MKDVGVFTWLKVENFNASVEKYGIEDCDVIITAITYEEAEALKDQEGIRIACLRDLSLELSLKENDPEFFKVGYGPFTVSDLMKALASDTEVPEDFYFSVSIDSVGEFIITTSVCLEPLLYSIEGQFFFINDETKEATTSSIFALKGMTLKHNPSIYAEDGVTAYQPEGGYTFAPVRLLGVDGKVIHIAPMAPIINNELKLDDVVANISRTIKYNVSKGLLSEVYLSMGAAIVLDHQDEVFRPIIYSR